MLFSFRSHRLQSFGRREGNVDGNVQGREGEDERVRDQQGPVREQDVLAGRLGDTGGQQSCCGPRKIVVECANGGNIIGRNY